LVAQGERQVQALRQPEWWAQGLAGGGTAVSHAIANLFNDASYKEMMGDPIYRELRRTALMEKLKASLRDAGAYGRAGKDDLARLSLRHAEVYQRAILAIDSQ